MCDSTELQQAENDDSAVSWSKYTFQESHKDIECTLTQESSEEEQTEHTSNYKHDVFSSDQFADQQESVVSQWTEKLQVISWKLQNHVVLQLLWIQTCCQNMSEKEEMWHVCNIWSWWSDM